VWLHFQEAGFQVVVQAIPLGESRDIDIQERVGGKKWVGAKVVGGRKGRVNGLDSSDGRYMVDFMNF
jgi:hypothetical protein